MKKTMKKIICSLLVVVMCLTVAPLQGFAADSVAETSELSTDYGEVIFNGYWYSGIKWFLYEDGTLVINNGYYSSFGNYSYPSDHPWHSHRDMIKRVIFTDKISEIPAYAFSNCISLEKVYFTQGNGEFEIGDCAFYYCTSLESFSVFRDAKIGERAFYSCESLKEFAMPYHTPVGDEAFAWCEKLNKIYIVSVGAQTYFSFNYYFADNSFYKVKAEVVMPYNTTYDGSKTFGGNLTWTTATYGKCGQDVWWSYDVEEKELRIHGNGCIIEPQSAGDDMPWWHFSDEIKSVYIEDGITEIESYVFEYCSSIETVRLPETLETLCCNAFNDCHKLNNLILPSSLKYFGFGLANRCYALTDAYYMGTREEYRLIEIEKNSDSFNSPDSSYVLHFLVDKSTAPTCKNEGTEVYYQFDNTDLTDILHGVLYDADKNVIDEPVVLPKTDHSYTKYVSNGDTTCTNYGTKTAYCDYGCGNSNTVPGDEYLEHSYTEVITKQPTHKEEGLKTFTCECGDTYTGVMAVIPHSYDEVVTAPNCTEQGYTTYTCSCGYSYVSNYTDKLDHSYTSEITTPATHFAEGIETFTCECGDTYTEPVAKIPHSYSNTVTAPTCTERGYTTYTCECGDSYVDDYVKANGHTYTSEITTQPTHLKEGVETFTCACGDAYTKAVSKLTGHTYTEQITKEPTHKEEGVKTFTCECGDTYTETVSKISHSYKKVVTAPTCSAKGYTTYICECGDSYVDDYVGTKSHTYTSTITRPATHLSTGIRTYTCTACGDSYPETIAKTKEHSYTISNIVIPTCENEGYTLYVCECGNSYKGDKTPAIGHNYVGDNCKTCGESKIDNCSCNCHKTGLMGIIWKIINFFNKLFKNNPTCACGVAHY